MVRKILTAAYADLLSLPIALEFMGVCVCVCVCVCACIRFRGVLETTFSVERKASSRTTVHLADRFVSWRFPLRQGFKQ